MRTFLTMARLQGLRGWVARQRPLEGKRATFVEYVPAVLSEVWGLGYGLVAGVIGAVALTVQGVSVAWWEWILIALLCMTPAQFLAYHRMRARLRAETRQAPGTTNIQNQTIHIYYPQAPPAPNPPALPPQPPAQPPPPQAADAEPGQPRDAPHVDESSDREA